MYNLSKNTHWFIHNWVLFNLKYLCGLSDTTQFQNHMIIYWQ